MSSIEKCKLIRRLLVWRRSYSYTFLSPQYYRCSTIRCVPQISTFSRIHWGIREYTSPFPKTGKSMEKKGKGWEKDPGALVSLLKMLGYKFQDSALRPKIFVNWETALYCDISEFLLIRILFLYISTSYFCSYVFTSHRSHKIFERGRKDGFGSNFYYAGTSSSSSSVASGKLCAVILFTYLRINTDTYFIFHCSRCASKSRRRTQMFPLIFLSRIQFVEKDFCLSLFVITSNIPNSRIRAILLRDRGVDAKSTKNGVLISRRSSPAPKGTPSLLFSRFEMLVISVLTFS